MRIYRIQKNGVGPIQTQCPINYRFPYELEYYANYLAPRF